MYILQRVVQENYRPLFDHEFQGTVKCIRNQKITDVDCLKIEIPEFQTKETEGFFLGIGSKTEIWFHIKSNLMPGRVKRVAQDFEWLSATLIKLYPIMAQLPELQPFKQEGNQANQLRRKEIEEYMHQISCRREFLRTQVLIDFLTLSTEKIIKYKKTYDSMNFVKGISLIKNESGEVEAELSNKLREFMKSCAVHNRRITIIHEKMHQSIAKLLKDYDVVKEDLYGIVDGFAQLHDMYSEHTNKFPESKSQSYNEMLVNLNNLFLGMGDNIKNNIKTVQLYLKNYYGLNFTYDRSLFRLSKMVRDSQKQYLQYKYQLSKKKERLYIEPEKWQINEKQSQHVKELLKQLSQIQHTNVNQTILLKSEINQQILPKETMVEKEMKMWYGFCLKNYEKQFAVWIKLLTDRYAQKYKCYATELLNNDKMYLETLSRFISQMLRHKKLMIA